MTPLGTNRLWADRLIAEGWCLEREGYAAADGAGGLDQVDRLAVLAENRDVSLGQQVAEVDDRFHVSAQGWESAGG